MTTVQRGNCFGVFSLKILAFVRFSEIIANPKVSFVAGKVDFDQYVKNILNPDRLRTRLMLLENVLLPSFANQSIPLDDSWFRLCIGTTKELPENTRTELEKIIAPYPWARIYTNKNTIVTTNEFLNEGNASEPFNYASMRIDDDDAIGRDRIKNILEYSSAEFSDFMISFPNGYVGWMDNESGKIIDAAHSYQPMNSVGLAYIGRYDPIAGRVVSSKTSIWETGSHNRVDRNFRTIIDSREPMFFRTIHSGQDTGEVSYREIKGKPKVTREEIFKSVSLSDRFVSHDFHEPIFDKDSQSAIDKSTILPIKRNRFKFTKRQITFVFISLFSAFSSYIAGLVMGATSIAALFE